MWFTKELAEGLARQTTGWTDANRTTIKDVVISYILAPEAPKAADDADSRNCPACWHLWTLHGADGCGAKAYPAHSLSGTLCPCEHTAPGGDDDSA